MKLIETLQLAWKNRSEIAEGFYNTWIANKPEIDAEALRRKTICETNLCGYYDATGKPETSSIPGLPACSICHCNITAKAHCMSCHCALKDINQSPLWNAMMTKEQEDILHATHYQKQFEKK